jgi:hypothetical protein
MMKTSKFTVSSILRPTVNFLETSEYLFTEEFNATDENLSCSYEFTETIHVPETSLLEMSDAINDTEFLRQSIPFQRTPLFSKSEATKEAVSISGSRTFTPVSPVTESTVLSETSSQIRETTRMLTKEQLTESSYKAFSPSDSPTSIHASFSLSQSDDHNEKSSKPTSEKSAIFSHISTNSPTKIHLNQTETSHSLSFGTFLSQTEFPISKTSSLRSEESDLTSFYAKRTDIGKKERKLNGKSSENGYITAVCLCVVVISIGFVRLMQMEIRIRNRLENNENGLIHNGA